MTVKKKRIVIDPRPFFAKDASDEFYPPRPDITAEDRRDYANGQAAAREIIHGPSSTKRVRCRLGRHFWSTDAAEGDTCNCGDWYRFYDHIEVAP